MLSISGLDVAYGQSQVLWGVDLEVRAGELVCLMGRNGVGKTTLLKTTIGLLPVRGGRVTFDGADITTWSPDRRARAGIGYVPQGREIFPHLSVEENLRMALLGCGPFYGTNCDNNGIDLFNAGFYWEAHEAWESLWHLCGRSGRMADFLKGLIKLAAAGVKVRENRRQGAADHARAAAALFRRTGVAGERYLGLPLDDLIRFADAIADDPPTGNDPTAAVEIVFPFVLRPEQG